MFYIRQLFLRLKLEISFDKRNKTDSERLPIDQPSFS